MRLSHFLARLTFPSSRSVNSQRSTGDTSPEPIRLAGANSRVMQWLVLCGIPYRGPGALASPDPTNWFHHFCFPLPSCGAGHSGHREALLLIFSFLRVPLDTLFCKRLAHQTFPTSLQLFENNKGLASAQALTLWKMWESAVGPSIYACFSFSREARTSQ